MVRRLTSLAVLAVTLVVAAPAAGDNSSKIAALQSRIAAARQRESTLNSQIAGVTSQIRKLEGRVGDVSQKLSVLEQDLALHQKRLNKLNALYLFETQRLHFLQRRGGEEVAGVDHGLGGGDQLDAALGQPAGSLRHVGVGDDGDQPDGF